MKKRGKSKSKKPCLLSFRDKWKLGKSSKHEMCSFNETPQCYDLFFSHTVKSPSAALCPSWCLCLLLPQAHYAWLILAQQSRSRLTERKVSLEFSMGQSPAVPGVLVFLLLLTCLQNITNRFLKISSSCKNVTVVGPLLSNNMRREKILQNNYRKIVTEVNTKFQPCDGTYPSEVLS